MAGQNNKPLIDKIEKINRKEQEEKRKTEETKIKATSAEDEFKVALKQEIGQGLTEVKREKDRVIITVGSAGAFRSGSAELTENAKKIMMKQVGEDAFEILDGVNPLPTSIHVNLTADYVNPDSAAKFAKSIMKGNEHIAVSYTHLTLPTSYAV